MEAAKDYGHEELYDHLDSAYTTEDEDSDLTEDEDSEVCSPTKILILKIGKDDAKNNLS